MILVRPAQPKLITCRYRPWMLSQNGEWRSQRSSPAARNIPLPVCLRNRPSRMEDGWGSEWGTPQPGLQTQILVRTLALLFFCVQWKLSCRPIFIVPVHADPSAHFFCCPPGQQVLELQWRPHITNPVKCSDEMENGFTVHVLGHVVQSSPDLVTIFLIKCRRVFVVNQLANCATWASMLRRVSDGASLLGI